MCLPSSLCKYVISVVLFCYVVCFVFFMFCFVFVMFCFLNLRQEILKNKCMIWWYIYQLHVKKKNNWWRMKTYFDIAMRHITYIDSWRLKKGGQLLICYSKEKTTHVLITWPFFSFVSFINKNGFSCLNWIIELNC